MANFNQKPADKVSSKPNFIKIVLKILLAWILFNAVRIGISDALKQPSYLFAKLNFRATSAAPRSGNARQYVL